MKRGYFKVWYKIQEWGWWDNTLLVGVFIKLVAMANKKKRYWHGTTIERGQFVSSTSQLAASLGLSPQATKTVLSKLKSTNELTSKATNQFTIYTIENFDKYQMKFSEATNEQPAKQPTSNQRATNEQPQLKSVKSVKSVKSERVCETSNPHRCETNKTDAKELKRAVGYFMSAYHKKYDTTYMVTAADRKAMKIMLMAKGYDYVVSITDFHFSDVFWDDKGRSITRLNSSMAKFDATAGVTKRIKRSGPLRYAPTEKQEDTEW